MLALSVASTPVVAQEPSPSGPADAGIRAVIADALDTAAQAGSVADLEAARRQADRDALGVMDIDPALQDIMVQLDVLASDLLTGYVDDLQNAVEPAASPGVSPSADATRHTRTIALAQSTGQYLTFGMAIAAAEVAIKEWQPKSGSRGALPDQPFTTSGNFESHGRFTYYTATLSSTGSVRDGVIEIGYEFTMESQVLDSATNATLESIDDRGSYRTSINPCPRAGGRVDSRTEAESAITVRRAAGGSRSIQDHAVVTGATIVDDQAEVASTTTDLTTRRTSHGDSSTDVGFTARYGADGVQSATATQQDGTEADLQAAARGAAASALAGVHQLVDAARSVWRSRCLTLAVDPGGREVSPGSVTSIHVTVHHEVEDADIEVPVRAELEGSESVDPANEPAKAPADFTYRAGTKPHTDATITFRSISNRGIVTRAEKYPTSAELVLDVDGDVDASAGGEKSTYTITGRDLKVTFGPGDVPSVHLAGRLRIKGTARSASGCTSRYQGSFKVDRDDSASLVGGPGDTRLVFVLLAEDPSATVTVKTRCPGTGATSSKFPIVALVGAWAALLPPAELPITGGKAIVTGPAGPAGGRQSWTVSLRPASR